jgi:hypothetical protein
MATKLMKVNDPFGVPRMVSKTTARPGGGTHTTAVVQDPYLAGWKDPYAGIIGMYQKSFQTPGQLATTAAKQVAGELSPLLTAQRNQNAQEQAQYLQQSQRAQSFAQALNALNAGDPNAVKQSYMQAAGITGALGTGLTGAVASDNQAANDQVQAQISQMTGGLATSPGGYSIPGMQSTQQLTGVTMPGSTLAEQAANAMTQELAHKVAATGQIGAIAQNYLAQGRDALQSENAAISNILARRPDLTNQALQTLQTNQQNALQAVGNLIGARDTSANAYATRALQEQNQAQQYGLSKGQLGVQRGQLGLQGQQFGLQKKQAGWEHENQVGQLGLQAGQLVLQGQQAGWQHENDLSGQAINWANVAINRQNSDVQKGYLESAIRDAAIKATGIDPTTKKIAYGNIWDPVTKSIVPESVFETRTQQRIQQQEHGQDLAAQSATDQQNFRLNFAKTYGYDPISKQTVIGVKKRKDGTYVEIPTPSTQGKAPGPGGLSSAEQASVFQDAVSMVNGWAGDAADQAAQAGILGGGGSGKVDYGAALEAITGYFEGYGYGRKLAITKAKRVLQAARVTPEKITPKGQQGTSGPPPWSVGQAPTIPWLGGWPGQTRPAPPGLTGPSAAATYPGSTPTLTIPGG